MITAGTYGGNLSGGGLAGLLKLRCHTGHLSYERKRKLTNLGGNGKERDSATRSHHRQLKGYEQTHIFFTRGVREREGEVIILLRYQERACGRESRGKKPLIGKGKRKGWGGKRGKNLSVSTQKGRGEYLRWLGIGTHKTLRGGLAKKNSNKREGRMLLQRIEKEKRGVKKRGGGRDEKNGGISDLNSLEKAASIGLIVWGKKRKRPGQSLQN